MQFFANLDYMAKLALEMLQMKKRRRREIFLCLFLRGFGKSGYFCFGLNYVLSAVE